MHVSGTSKASLEEDARRTALKRGRAQDQLTLTPENYG